MPYESSFEIAKAIKISLEERSLISRDFKLKVLNEENAHKVDKNAFNRNAAEMLWGMVHKFSRELINSPTIAAKKTPPIVVKSDKRKIESADDDFSDIDEFINSINKMATKTLEKQKLLTELWDFRTGLLNALILEKRDVKLTFSILEVVLAKELGVDDKTISAWLIKVNHLFSRNVFGAGKPVENLGKLMQSDPLFAAKENYFAELKQEQSKIVAVTESKQEELQEALAQSDSDDEMDIFDHIEDLEVNKEKEEKTLNEQMEKQKQQQANMNKMGFRVFEVKKPVTSSNDTELVAGNHKKLK